MPHWCDWKLSAVVPGEAEDCWGGVLATGWGLQKGQGLVKTLIPEEQPRLIKGKLLSVGSISTRGIFFAIYLEPVVFGSQWRPSSYWWVCEANVGTDKHLCVGWFLSKGEFEALHLSHTLQLLDSVSHKTTEFSSLPVPFLKKQTTPRPNEKRTKNKT